LADAIKADMVERFRDRYDLSELPERVQKALEERPETSWRSALSDHISKEGRGLRSEIEQAVREYLE
jgi:hypothetical protein